MMFVENEEMPSIVVHCVVLGLNCWSGGAAPVSLWPVISLVVTHCLFSRIHKSKADGNRIVALILLSWVFQAFIVAVVLSLQQEAVVPYMICSTIILSISEVTPLLPAWYNLLAIAKHVLMWQLVVAHLGLPACSYLSSLFPLVWSLFHLLQCVSSRQLTLTKTVGIETRRDEQSKLVSLVLAIPDGVVVLTEDKKIAAYNHMFLEQMGLSQSMSYGELYDEVAKLRYEGEFGAGGKGGMLEDDILSYIHSGDASSRNFPPVLVNTRHLEWRGKLGQWDDKLVCIATVRDTSRWVEMEHTAKKESMQKSALLRSVSHELRTPTNAVINKAVEMWEKAEEREKSEFQVIISSSRLLLSMIIDLLDFSQMSYSSLKLTKSKFRLKPAIEDCFQLIKPQCDAKSLSFRLLYDTSLPEVVLTDESRLKQVVIHLLSNAAK